LLETASKAKLIDLNIRMASTRPAVRHECLDYLNKRAALSPSQKKQSEGENCWPCGPDSHRIWTSLMLTAAAI